MKTRDDYVAFLEERERYFVSILERWGFRQAGPQAEEVSAEILDE
jgi:hypothetical protein